MVVKMFLSVIYYQVEDMHQLSTVGSQHDRGSLVKIYFFCLFFLVYFFLSVFSLLFFCNIFLCAGLVTHSVSVSACGSVITIDSSSEPQLCNPMWPGLSVMGDEKIVTGQ